MAIEYGIFTDEGLVEDGFYERDDAEKRAALYRDGVDVITVCELCPDHPEHARETCEECATSEASS